MEHLADIVAYFNDQSNIATIHKCLPEIKHNFLQLNLSKSDVIVFDSTSSTDDIKANLGELAPLPKSLARNLGVVLRFEYHIKKVVQSCFYHLRNMLLFQDVYDCYFLLLFYSGTFILFVVMHFVTCIKKCDTKC